MADSSWGPVCNRQEEAQASPTSPSLSPPQTLPGLVFPQEVFHAVLKPEPGDESQGEITVEGELLLFAHPFPSGFVGSPF